MALQVLARTPCLSKHSPPNYKKSPSVFPLSGVILSLSPLAPEWRRGCRAKRGVPGLHVQGLPQSPAQVVVAVAVPLQRRSHSQGRNPARRGALRVAVALAAARASRAAAEPARSGRRRNGQRGVRGLRRGRECGRKCGERRGCGLVLGQAAALAELPTLADGLRVGFRDQLRDISHGLQKPMGRHPVIADELGEVVSDGVRQQHHTPLALVQNSGSPQRPRNRSPAASPNKKALLADQPTGHLKRLPVLGHLPPVNDRPVQHFGHKVVPDALHQVRPPGGVVVVHDAAVGVHPDNHQPRVLPLQATRNTRQRAPCPRGHHNHVHSAVTLLPDLLCRPALVGLRVRGVRVLVQEVHRPGVLTDQPPSHSNVTLRCIPRSLRGRADNLRPQGLQHGNLLRGHLLRQSDGAAVPLRRGHKRKPYPRVATAGLHNRVAVVDPSKALRVPNHLQRDPVLHRAPGVHELALRHQVTRQPAPHSPQTHHGGLPHALQDALLDSLPRRQLPSSGGEGGHFPLLVSFCLSWGSTRKQSNGRGGGKIGKGEPGERRAGNQATPSLGIRSCVPPEKTVVGPINPPPPMVGTAPHHPIVS
eukprot:RCo022946